MTEVNGGDPDPRIRIPVDTVIDDHIAAVDPHGDRAYADGIVTGVVGDIAAAQAAADAAQLAADAAQADIDAHEVASDPHTQYQKESEKDSAGGYAGLDGSSKLTGSQQAYGSSANTACEGNDSRLSDARTPTGSAGGVLSGTYPNPGFAVDMATQAELDAAVATTFATALKVASLRG